MRTAALRYLPVLAVATTVLSGGGAQAAQEGPVGAEMVGRAYLPSSLTIGVGQTVVWQNRSITHHTVTSTTGAFESSSIGPGESYSVTFSDPGTFDYKCTIHPTMKGDVIVLDLPAGTLQLHLSRRHTRHGPLVVAQVRAARSGPLLVQARAGSGWRTVARGTLDAQGAATLVLSAPSGSTLRVALPAEHGQPSELSGSVRSPA